MEEQWVTDRQRLRKLLATRPEWNNQDLADAIGRSRSWVKKWKKRIATPAASDDQALHSQSRARKIPPPRE